MKEKLQVQKTYSQKFYLSIYQSICLFIYTYMLWIEPRALCMFGKHSTTDLHSQLPK